MPLHPQDSFPTFNIRRISEADPGDHAAHNSELKIRSRTGQLGALTYNPLQPGTGHSRISMRTAKIINVALIAVLLGSTATSAYAGLGFHYDIRKPFNPPSVTATVGSKTYTATGGPAGPTVTSNGTDPADKLLNQAAGPQTAANKAADDAVNATGKGIKDAAVAINKVIDDAGRGIGHFFNEIGMLWANFKNDMQKKGKEIADDFFKWLKEQAEKYGLYALAGIGALFMVRGFVRFLVGGRNNYRHA
jgi:hypothetical protein